jgi:hypothetical protein
MLCHAASQQKIYKYDLGSPLLICSGYWITLNLRMLPGDKWLRIEAIDLGFVGKSDK